jgi:hypothetical protein
MKTLTNPQPYPMNYWLVIMLFGCFFSCTDDPINPPEEKLSVSTFAGNGIEGHVDGIGTSAQLTGYTSIVVGPDDKVYLTHRRRRHIRNITQAGLVSTWQVEDEPIFNLFQHDYLSLRWIGLHSIAFDPEGSLVTSCNLEIIEVGDANVALIVKNAFQSPHLLFNLSIGMNRGVSIAYDTKGKLYGTNGLFLLLIEEATKHFGSGNILIDGQGNPAMFKWATDMVADQNNNLVVADPGNHCIRKVTPDGMMSTLAGTNIAGFADGHSADARFNNPSGIAIDKEGNIYVADTGNHAIRKISCTGYVTTLAGDGTEGFLDGDPLKARFSSPNDVAVNSEGHVFIMDTGNYRVRVLK